ncbi:MAG: glucose-6-phosphate isomerase [Deltaproteobacteria bacterium]|nr:glucose-6-phosphate isomerase [Deltaproteobacteria bacterium]
MLTFDFTNCCIPEAEFDALRPEVLRAHTVFQQWRKSGDAVFFDLPDLPGLTDGLHQKAKEIAERFDNLVVLGIGGSALGLRCLVQALLSPWHNLLDRKGRKGRPRLFVCDNIDPRTFALLLDHLDFSQTCFHIISKSGRTIETAAQFFIVLKYLQEKIGKSWRDHLVITTDAEGGELRPFVKKEGIASFSLPAKLGGRYSVLSAVGLFPAAVLGMPIDDLLKGARQMTERCAHAELDANAAYRLAAIHALLEKQGKKISVMMPYADGLSLFADWYVQLWAESLGKGGKGTTPVKSLGSTDQHSLLQLYMDGPNDKVTTFLRVEKFHDQKAMTTVRGVSENFSFLEGHDLGTILNVQQRATAQALAKANRPNLTVTLPELNARHMGQLLMVYQIATAFAGALAGSNPFDQPGVELSKKLTREMLTSS